MRQLSAALEAPAVLGCFSRLLIDPNRGEDDPTLIMKISDGAVIPGNHPITDEEWQNRLNRFHRPYHEAVSQTIAEAAAASGKAPLVISLHSFTPAWKGIARPWHAAVLWDNDPRAVFPVIERLESAGDIVVGNNEPYDGALRGDTIPPLHGAGHRSRLDRGETGPDLRHGGRHCLGRAAGADPRGAQRNAGAPRLSALSFANRCL
ncbi:putative N-formylglutamate amidohydrolase [Sinorhizobium fredii]